MSLSCAREIGCVADRSVPSHTWRASIATFAPLLDADFVPRTRIDTVCVAVWLKPSTDQTVRRYLVVEE